MLTRWRVQMLWLLFPARFSVQFSRSLVAFCSHSLPSVWLTVLSCSLFLSSLTSPPVIPCQSSLRVVPDPSELTPSALLSFFLINLSLVPSAQPLSPRLYICPVFPSLSPLTFNDNCPLQIRSASNPSSVRTALHSLLLLPTPCRSPTQCPHLCTDAPRGGEGIGEARDYPGSARSHTPTPGPAAHTARDLPGSGHWLGAQTGAVSRVPMSAMHCSSLPPIIIAGTFSQFLLQLLHLHSENRQCAK